MESWSCTAPKLPFSQLFCPFTLIPFVCIISVSVHILLIKCLAKCLFSIVVISDFTTFSASTFHLTNQLSIYAFMYLIALPVHASHYLLYFYLKTPSGFDNLSHCKRTSIMTIPWSILRTPAQSHPPIVWWPELHTILQVRPYQCLYGCQSFASNIPLAGLLQFISHLV